MFVMAEYYMCLTLPTTCRHALHETRCKQDKILHVTQDEILHETQDEIIHKTIIGTVHETLLDKLN